MRKFCLLLAAGAFWFAGCATPSVIPTPTPKPVLPAPPIAKAPVAPAPAPAPPVAPPPVSAPAPERPPPPQVNHDLPNADSGWKGRTWNLVSLNGQQVDGKTTLRVDGKRASGIVDGVGAFTNIRVVSEGEDFRFANIPNAARTMAASDFVAALNRVERQQVTEVDPQASTAIRAKWTLSGVGTSMEFWLF